MNKVTMREIHKAWNDAVDALFKHDDKIDKLSQEDRRRARPLEMEEFFMTELNKLNHDICDIVTHMYCEYEELNK